MITPTPEKRSAVVLEDGRHGTRGANSSDVREMQTKVPIRRDPIHRVRRPIVVAVLALAGSLSAEGCSIYDLGGLETGGASGAGGAAGDRGSSTGGTGGGAAGGMGGSDTENTGGSAGSLGTENDAAAPSGAAGTTIGAGGSSGGAASMGGGSGTGGGEASGGGGGDAGVDASVPDASPDARVADVVPERNHPVCAVGQCKLVFVSSSSVPAGVGGVENFDRVCQKLADGRNLAGDWKAWVSDESGSVTTRMTQATVPYRLLDGSTIARDWPELASGALLHAINVREDATTLSGGVEVWTGTLPNGARATFYCSNWTTTSGAGIVGMSDADFVPVDLRAPAVLLDAHRAHLLLRAVRAFLAGRGDCPRLRPRWTTSRAKSSKRTSLLRST